MDLEEIDMLESLLRKQARRVSRLATPVSSMANVVCPSTMVFLESINPFSGSLPMLVSSGDGGVALASLVLSSSNMDADLPKGAPMEIGCNVSLIREPLMALSDEPLMMIKVSLSRKIPRDAIGLTNLHIEMSDTTSILTLEGPPQDNVLGLLTITTSKGLRGMMFFIFFQFQYLSRMCHKH